MFQWDEQTVPSTGSPVSAIAFFVSATFMPGESISMPWKPAAFTARNLSVSDPSTRTMPIFSVLYMRPVRSVGAVGAACVMSGETARAAAEVCRKRRRQSERERITVSSPAEREAKCDTPVYQTAPRMGAKQP